MKKIIAYEMSFTKEIECSDEKLCIPFQQKYWNEYKQKYNECFYEMRKDLEVEPINFYSSYSQMIDKASNTYLYLENGSIAGAVSCYENEIDDLFVDKAFQRQGLGRKLLLWGISHIKQQGYNEIILHVAKWNQNAIKLYLETGFTIQKEERVR
jgi:ribosomal protein S18 acetylase RimI-like enzyme